VLPVSSDFVYHHTVIMPFWMWIRSVVGTVGVAASAYPHSSRLSKLQPKSTSKRHDAGWGG
jgi:uncharacterized membrane protein (DUF106 family)